MANELPLMSEDVEIIQKLGNFPNADDGLSAEEVKEKFDAGPKVIKDYINETLVPAVRDLQRNKVDGSDLGAVVEGVLEQAKASGEFDGPRGIQGEKGDTPVKGVDYWTDADKQEILDDVLDAIPDAGGSGELRYCADCHTVTEGGSYYIDANTLNRPDDVSAGTLFVERVPKSSGIDTNLTLNDSGTILRCAYSSSAGTWDEWEWENPPYKFNKVYRTMERYNSLPVYAIKVPTGGFAYGMTSFSFNKGFTDDPNYVPAGWNVIAFDNVIFHDAVYGYNAADVIADYSASKYVESISAVFAETGLKIDIALKTTNLGGESTMNFVVKFVKADIV